MIALVRGMLNLFLRRKKVRNEWITGYCRLQRTHWFCPQTLGKRRAHFSAAFGGAFQKRQAFLANHAVFGLWIQISEEPAPKLGCNFWELCLHMALSPKIIKMQGKDDALQRHVCALKSCQFFSLTQKNLANILAEQSRLVLFHTFLLGSQLRCVVK